MISTINPQRTPDKKAALGVLNVAEVFFDLGGDENAFNKTLREQFELCRNPCYTGVERPKVPD